ncbi:MAG: LCP family protein [Clostridia bacterium]|nr:LCP family protein [Clostridia bacterium]
MNKVFLQIKNNKKIYLTVFAALVVIVGVVISIAIMNKPKTPVVGIGDIAKGDVSLGRVNILAGGRDRTSGLYDSLMLIGFDRDAESICVLQIPRDTYAEYTDGSYRKINGAAASLGGMDELVLFLEETMGVNIDGYVSFDLEVVSEIVDAIDGVTVDVPRNMHYKDDEQGLNISLTKGERHLNGKEAEMLIRYRSGYAKGDIERLDTQKIFLEAMIKKVRETSSLSLILELLPTLDSFDTDFSLSQMTTVAYEAEKVADENIFFETVPGDAAIAQKSGAGYYVICKNDTEAVLKKHFGGEEFDTSGVFLNSNYSEFEEIYYRR